MIVNTPRGRYQLRAQLFGGADAIPLPSQEHSQYGGSWSSAGRRVSRQQAVGLPPVLAGQRLIAETVGTLPFVVYNEDGEAKVKRPDTWQWDLLRKRPNDIQSPFDFKAFMVASMIGYGGFAAQKAIARSGRLKGEVLALYPMDPRTYVPCYENGDLVFKVRDPKGQGTITLNRSQVLYVPGVLVDDPYIGVSPISIATNTVGTSLGVEEFSGRFFDRDATPSGVIEYPGNVDTQQGQDVKRLWRDSYGGARKSHGTAVLGGGATYKQIGVNAQDAQIIESQRWTVEQAARILRLPAWALGGVDQNPRSTPEERGADLLQYSISPWLVRAQEGFWLDDDLFPDKELIPEVLANGITRADMLARYQAHTQARQAGWKSVNDIRGEEGLAPIPGGDQYQQTPVGGAENLQPGQADSPTETVDPSTPTGD